MCSPTMEVLLDDATDTGFLGSKFSIVDWNHVMSMPGWASRERSIITDSTRNENVRLYISIDIQTTSPNLPSAHDFQFDRNRKPILRQCCTIKIVNDQLVDQISWARNLKVNRLNIVNQLPNIAPKHFSHSTLSKAEFLWSLAPPMPLACSATTTRHFASKT